MSVLRRTFLVLCCVFLFSGCYEDRAELTLNSDGSGTFKQRLVFSERYIVATSENKGSQRGPVPDKEELVKKIGSAMEIISIKQTDLPDGRRVIELEGTFSKPEQFFFSEFCQKYIKLRLALAGDGKAAIYCKMEQYGSGGPSLTQFYGLAKGLHISRMVHLPTEIEKTNGHLVRNTNTVSWIIDLRNKEALAETKMFIEGADKGKGFAVFSDSALKFSLPLKVEASSEKTVEVEKEKAPKEPAGLAAEVSWISVQRAKSTDGSDIAEKSYTEIGVELSWNEDHRPVRHNKPVLLSLLDDKNNDLLTGDEQPFMQLTIYDHQKKKEFKLKTKAPYKDAKKLKNLEGYVEVVTGVVKESVVLENIKELVGKDSTENPVLDKLNFRIKSIEGRTLRLEIDGGHKTITSLAMIKDDGSKVEQNSNMSWGNSCSYDFEEDISRLSKCELEVVVSESMAMVLFSLEEMSLP